MQAIDAVDPEYRALLEAFPTFAFTAQTLPLVRAGLQAQIVPADATAAQARGVWLETLSIPGPQGAPPLRLLAYHPAEATGPVPALLHIHGGGYIIGSADMTDAANRELAATLNAAVFSVEYRLAPETPHPGPVEDVYAALTYLFAHAESLGIDPARIGVKGESAGGGLAAAVALLARDRGEVALAFQHLIYPMIDDRTGAPGQERNPHSGAFIWSYESNQFGWASHLGQAPGGADVPAYAAPARAETLAGLPPTYISCGTLDIFLEENLTYASRLVRAGVPVTFNLYPAVPHGFDSLQPEARTSKQAARDTLEALRRALYP